MSIKKIATVTVGAGGAASIDFTSIPGTATDLMLVMSARTASDGGDTAVITLKFNDDTSGWSYRLLQGTGTTALSGTSYIGVVNGSGATANTFGNGSFYIPNYTVSQYKSVSGDSVIENNATGGRLWMAGGIWSNNAVITSLSITSISNFAQYSTATLYGVTKGSLAGVTVS
jgi:hypothetical protein